MVSGVQKDIQHTAKTALHKRYAPHTPRQAALVARHLLEQLAHLFKLAHQLVDISDADTRASSDTLAPAGV